MRPSSPAAMRSAPRSRVPSCSSRARSLHEPTTGSIRSSAPRSTTHSRPPAPSRVTSVSVTHDSERLLVADRIAFLHEAHPLQPDRPRRRAPRATRSCTNSCTRLGGSTRNVRIGILVMAAIVVLMVTTLARREQRFWERKISTRSTSRGPRAADRVTGEPERRVSLGGGDALPAPTRP